MKTIQKAIVILLTVIAFSCKSSSPVLIEKEISINQVKEDLLKMGISLKDEFKISENLADKEGEYQKTTLIISDVDKKQVELLNPIKNDVGFGKNIVYDFKIVNNQLIYKQSIIYGVCGNE